MLLRKALDKFRGQVVERQDTLALSPTLDSE
jgi:hypothetical protein